MKTLKTKINESRSDKRTLRAFVKSVEKTVRNMAYFPEIGFLSDIVNQILINEGLEDRFELEIGKSSIKIVERHFNNNIEVAKIEIITEKFPR